MSIRTARVRTVSHLPFAVVVASASLSLALCSPSAAAVNLEASAALTTDYVWRGTTQTQGNPAVQAGFKVSGSNGLYGAIWGSGVEFAPGTKASSEFDFTVGWVGKLSEDWTLDANLTHYRYPSVTVDLDWTEAIGALTWKQNYWAQLGYSNDALATGEAGAYAQLGAKFPLDDNFRIEIALGHYWLEDAYDDCYSHAQLGAVWMFNAPFEVRITAHTTDGAATVLFPDLAGSRVEAALQASF